MNSTKSIRVCGVTSWLPDFITTIGAREFRMSAHFFVKRHSETCDLSHVDSSETNKKNQPFLFGRPASSMVDGGCEIGKVNYMHFSYIIRYFRTSSKWNVGVFFFVLQILHLKTNQNLSLPLRRPLSTFAGSFLSDSSPCVCCITQQSPTNSPRPLPWEMLMCFLIKIKTSSITRVNSSVKL